MTLTSEGKDRDSMGGPVNLQRTFSFSEKSLTHLNSAILVSYIFIRMARTQTACVGFISEKQPSAGCISPAVDGGSGQRAARVALTFADWIMY